MSLFSAGPQLTLPTRLGIGCAAGATVFALRFVDQIGRMSTLPASSRVDDALSAMIASNIMLFPILILFGILVPGFWTNANNKVLLLFLAMILPAAGVMYIDRDHYIRTTSIFELNPIATAYAQGVSDQKCNNDLSALVDGFRFLFGERKYWVVVNASKDKTKAEDLAKKVNEEEPRLKAFVGKRKPCNEWYPVLAGDYVSEKEARRVLRQVKTLETVDTDPYLSDYPDRR
jgi:hypothetical protein